MRVTIKNVKQEEAIKMLMATRMSAFIWELVHNGWREFKHTDHDYERSWKKIHELLDEHGIDMSLINEQNT
jgi:hypothetical protein